MVKQKIDNILRNKVILLLLLLFTSLYAEHGRACHSLPLMNTGITVLPNGIEIDADSDPATCAAGCGNTPYWLDIEVRCQNVPWNGSAFNPGFYGPLNTYPFFQSAQMQKPNCVLQSYPTTFIPFGNLCPGDYKVRFRENHNADVSGGWTQSFTFTVPGTAPALNGQITTQSDTVCSGDCTILSAGVSGGCGQVLEYLWSTGSTNAQINVCPTNDSVFTVDITEQCTNTTTQASIEIIVEPPPDAGTVSASQTEVCEGETVDLTLVNYEDDIQWQFAPNPGGPWTDLAGAITDSETSPPLDNTNSCWRAEVGNCGTPSLSNVVCITVNAQPEITAQDYYICDGETIDIATTVSDPGGDYLWEIDNSTASQLPNIGPSDSTDYIVNYTLGNCDDKDTATVVVYKTPDAQIDIDSVCFEEETSFTDNSTLDNSNGDLLTQWSWEFGDGNTSSVQNPVHEYDSENVYDVSLKVETNNGCVDSITVQTVVYPLPVADFSVEDQCLDVVHNFENNSSVSSANTTNNITTYLWNFDDGNLSNEEEPTHTYDNDGNYDIELLVETNHGCKDSITEQVTVHPRPVPSIDNNILADCSPLCFTLSSGSIINNPSTMVNYSWYLNGELMQSSAEGSYEDCLYNDSDDTEVYDVKLRVESNEGCADSLSVEDLLTVYHNPVADFNYTPEELDIIESEVQFSNLSVKEDSVAWLFDDFDSSSENNPTIEFPEIGGDYWVNLLAVTDEGCRDSISKFVTVQNRILFYAPNTFTPDNDPLNEQFKIEFPPGFTPENFELVIYNRWGEIVFESRNHLVGWDGTYGADSQRNVPDGTYVWKMQFREIQTDKKYEETGHVNVIR